MIKYFSKAFKITNDNIILTTPLLLFLILFIFYIGVVRVFSGNLLYSTLITVTAFSMLSAFFAGWFFMIKKAIELDKQKFDSEDSKAKSSFGLIKEIPRGVGEYFLPFVGGLIFYGLLVLLFMFLTYKAGLFFIGKLSLSPEDLRAALSSHAQMKAFISSLSVKELVKLNEWDFLIMTVMTFFSFMTMFWVPEIINKTKNVFLALFKSIRFIFKNFLSAIILFVYISAVNFLISLFSSLASINPILHFFATLIYFYFVVYIVVLIFLYYDNESAKVKCDKSEAQDNCNCGADSVGEEPTCDSNGEES